MSIVLFGGEKGGTGKTTLATNIAAMLAQKGRDVLLLDTDRQGSASAWATVREEDGIEPRVACLQKFGKGLAGQVRDLAGRYDDIVIDAGGRDSMELRYALGVADRAFIPVQPFQFDIWTIRQMDSLVEMAQGYNADLEAFVILNRISPNPAIREGQEALDFLAQEQFEHLALAESMVHDRIAFRKAARGGMSVIEWGDDLKAVQEMTALLGEIFR
ncbi:AAA family ATPase [Desulfurivibrio sp. D14AmB]|uniref:nucleotide-binding protein n=1 Tax=Desulfurivibrio sp. D14AmB TaxID=3374370 RepID=UPI00376F3CF6